MSNTSLARPGEETNGRVERGRELYAERAHDFRFVSGVWFVPSASTGYRTYAVKLEPVESCECKDFEYRGHDYGPCKHIVAGRIAHAKSRVCSCCRRRLLGRFLSEVTEDDGLLAWYPGDALCGDCIRDGFWA